MINADQFPRCRTCKWWNEFEEWYMKEAYPEATWGQGACEHPELRGPLVQVRLGTSRNAEVVLGEFEGMPEYYFNTGEDFGCILHSDVTPRRRGKEKRLKIENRVFEEAVIDSFDKSKTGE